MFERKWGEKENIAHVGVDFFAHRLPFDECKSSNDFRIGNETIFRISFDKVRHSSRVRIHFEVAHTHSHTHTNVFQYQVSVAKNCSQRHLKNILVRGPFDRVDFTSKCILVDGERNCTHVHRTAMSYV